MSEPPQHRQDASSPTDGYLYRSEDSRPAERHTAPPPDTLAGAVQNFNEEWKRAWSPLITKMDRFVSFVNKRLGGGE